MGKPDLRSRSESALRVRYEKAIELALDFMSRHRLTQAGLADVLGVNVSSLNRFLNQSAGHTPNPERPGKMQILERIEEKCALVNAFVQLERRTPKTDALSLDASYEIWFDNFQERLVVLEQKYEPATALAICPELCVQAISAPAPWGPSMAVNLLLRLLGHCTNLSAGDATETLLRATVVRVRALEAAANEKASERLRSAMPHKILGYAGATLAWLGFRLADDLILDEGLNRLLRASLMPHDFASDGHCVNLLMLLEVLLDAGYERAEARSAEVAAAAERSWHPNFDYVLDTHVLPCVHSHWKRVIPERVAEH